MNDETYYSIEFTPAMGAYKLALFINEMSDEKGIELYKIFLAFPFFDDDEFLQFLLTKRTKEFYKIISQYSSIKGNNFWINYSLKYEMYMKRCFETIYFSFLFGILINENGVIKKNKSRVNFDFLDFEGACNAIPRLGKCLENISLVDLLILLKVGESV